MDQSFDQSSVEIAKVFLEAFLNHVTRDLGMNRLPEPQQFEVLAKFLDLTDRRINRSAMRELEDEKVGQPLLQRIEDGLATHDVGVWIVCSLLRKNMDGETYGMLLGLLPGVKERLGHDLQEFYKTFKRA